MQHWQVTKFNFIRWKDFKEKVKDNIKKACRHIKRACKIETKKKKKLI